MKTIRSTLKKKEEVKGRTRSQKEKKQHWKNMDVREKPNSDWFRAGQTERKNKMSKKRWRWFRSPTRRNHREGGVKGREEGVRTRLAYKSRN